MRTATVRKLAVLLSLLLVGGCSSNNKGKIEGTTWINGVSTIKAGQVPAGMITLEFRTDGTFSMIAKDPTGKNVGGNGTYSVGYGDYVTLTFDKPLEGQKTHRQKIVINGDNMQFIDSDGTTLNFTRKKAAGQ